MRYKHIGLGLLCAFVLFILDPQTISAARFQQDYAVTYSFTEHGNATVVKRITITNRDANTYPSAIVVEIPEDASNIAAFDRSGNIAYDIEEADKRKQARLQLNERIIGENKSSEIVVQYETRQLAHREGVHWEIAIPSVFTQTEYTQYTIAVELPEEWGTPSNIQPQPTTPLTWTAQELQTQEIRIFYEYMSPTPTIEVLPTIVEESSAPVIIGIGIVLGSFVVAFLIYRILH
jgi:hypothetical protein